MTYSQNHICFTSTNAVADISRPLFESSHLNFFSYGRVFNTNDCFVFHSDHKFIENWFKFEAPAPSCWPDGVYFWDDILTEQLIGIRHELNVGNGIIVVKHHQNYTEIFAFNSANNTSRSMSAYINEMNSLNRFNLYFKDQASKLIQQGMENPIKLSDPMIKRKEEDPQKSKLESLMESLKINYYYFNERYDGIKLTKREVECLSLYLKGKTSHDIATKLLLNKKTIDTFLSLIKKKFDCRTRSELFEIIWELGILKSNGWIQV